MGVTIIDDEGRRTFELRADGELAALVTYGRKGDMLALTHTQTEPGFEGRGYAKQLVAHILDGAKQRGDSVLPFCPFVNAYIANHRADYLELIPEREQPRFGQTGIAA